MVGGEIPPKVAAAEAASPAFQVDSVILQTEVPRVEPGKGVRALVTEDREKSKEGDRGN